MPPAYRPGMVPRVALTPRMGSRARGQLMNDLMAECPSLLDDLVFYPMWQGSQCVDMITGAVLAITGTPTPSGTPNGEPGASMVGAYITGPVIDLRPDTTIAGWINPIALPAAGTAYAIANKTFNSSMRDVECILMESGFIQNRVFNSSGTSLGAIASNAVAVGMWHMWTLRIESNAFVQTVDSNSKFLVNSGTVANSNLPILIGREPVNVRSSNALFGQFAVWKRLLSSQENDLLYNNGSGLRYPFRR